MTVDAPQDAVAVQATNDSSIVSKLSMIQLGYVDDAYLAPLLGVNGGRMKRRAPLINRGYYIRHRAVAHLIERFLNFFASDATSNVQIVSLGCGFDTAALRLQDRRSLLFVDVDFPELIARKGAMLTRMVESVEVDVERERLDDYLHSSRYVRIGCDLRDTTLLTAQLSTIAGFSFARPTLLISECVITYLPTDEANAVLRWASTTFADVAFVLYEQILPADAFGRTMLAHFEKRAAPIHAIYRYPTLDDQKERMRALGFPHVDAVDMNQFWFEHLSEAERARIQELEWFDEHEEWHVKCSHYFVSCATRETRFKMSEIRFGGDVKSTGTSLTERVTTSSASALQATSSSSLEYRRWGHTATRIDDNMVMLFGGYGATLGTPQCGRQNDVVLVELHDDDSGACTSFVETNSGTGTQPAPRMYHTAVFHDNTVYVFGGRDGPRKTSGDLWAWSAITKSWEVVETNGEEHPQGRFRHAAAIVTIDKGNNSILPADAYMLISGGQTAIDEKLHVLDDLWAFALSSRKWYRLPCLLDVPRHSHQIAIHDSRIIVVGGLNGGHNFASSCIAIDTHNFAVTRLPFDVRRYGFQLLRPYADSHPDAWICVGGVHYADEYVRIAEDMLLLDLKLGGMHHLHVLVNRPWMPLGLAAVACRDKIRLFGGGAIVFSMGHFMNETPLHIDMTPTLKPLLEHSWKMFSQLPWIRESVDIPVLQVDDPRLDDAMRKREPFIVCGSDIGTCKQRWRDHAYLSAAVDPSIKASVHACAHNRLGFAGHRNYEFEVMPWMEFIDVLFERERPANYYLRSIGCNPRKEASDLTKTFPTFAADVQLDDRLARWIHRQSEPSSLSQSEQSTLPLAEFAPHCHSSVLRMSTRHLHLWTHFDIMDNFLVQVTGDKFITMFPPDQAHNLYVDPTANQSSSPVLDIFAPYTHPFAEGGSVNVNGGSDTINRFPRFHRTAVKSARTAILRPGDILFIPALWFHNTFALAPADAAPAPIISVNIFWKHLNADEYDRKDLYGNKDLVKAMKAFELVEKAKALVESIGVTEDGDRVEGLVASASEADSYRKFYLDKLCEIMKTS